MRESTKKLTTSAMLLAVTAVLLYIRTLVPVYQLAFYLITSLIPAIVVIEYGIKQGALFVVACIIISLILPTDKITFLLYYSLFGIYAVVKYLIEKIMSKILLYIVKIAYITAVFFLNMYFASNVAGIVPEIMQKYNIWIVYAAVIIAFTVYDIMFSWFSAFYVKKIKRFIK